MLPVFFLGVTQSVFALFFATQSGLVAYRLLIGRTTRALLAGTFSFDRVSVNKFGTPIFAHRV